MYSFEKARRGFNPYLGGVMAGIVAVFLAALSGESFNISTFFAGMFEKAFLSPSAELSSTVEALFLGGVFLGALLSATSNGSFFVESIPDLWRSSFGGSPRGRLLMSFVGGIFLSIGMGMVGGCLWDILLQRSVNLNLSSLLSLFFMVVSAILTSRFIYNRR